MKLLLKEHSPTTVFNRLCGSYYKCFLYYSMMFRILYRCDTIKQKRRCIKANDKRAEVGQAAAYQVRAVSLTKSKRNVSDFQGHYRNYECHVRLLTANY